MRLSASRFADVGIGLLIVACVGLTRLVYEELTGPAATHAQAPARPQDASTTPSLASPRDTFSLPPRRSFSAIVERPLFAPTRRPVEAAADLGQLATFSLDGVMISPEGRLAIVIHGNPPTVARVREGQAIEGWSVTSVLPDRIVLSHDGTEHELGLKDKSQAPAGAPSRPRRAGHATP